MLSPGRSLPLRLERSIPIHQTHASEHVWGRCNLLTGRHGIQRSSVYC